MKKVRVGKSKVHGKGVIADENIRKGEHIQYIRGPIVFKAPHNARESNIIANWVGVEKNRWIVPEKPFIFLNHSCEPNAAVVGKRLLVALKNVKKDEEITMDYSLTDADPHWQLRCQCGSKSCRRYIGPIQMLPESVFKKYLPNIPRYFQKQYKRGHPRFAST